MGEALAEKKRVIAYIDGFNLFYGLKNASKGADWESYRQTGGKISSCIGRSLYWINIQSLIEAHIILSREECVSIKYFSAPRRVPELVGVTDEERAKYIESNERQRVFLEALKTLSKIEPIMGWYSEKNPHHCPKCAHEWAAFEEKQTDVNIAANMIADAYEKRADAMVVMSADADLVTPIKMVQGLGVPVRLLLPPGRKRAEHLRSVASQAQNVKIRVVRKHRLPDSIERTGLSTLRCPDRWCPPTTWPWKVAPPDPAAPNT